MCLGLRDNDCEKLDQEKSIQFALDPQGQRIITPSMGVVEPVKIVMLFWKLVFCAGKLSDVLYVPPWRIATGGGKDLTVIGSIKSGAWHPKWRLVVSIRFLVESLSQER